MTIQKDTLAITVSEWGAELISVKHRGKERIWQNENGEWSGHAPVLFPVCGACEVRVAGKVYACPRHGFAMHERFTLTEKSENRLTYRLISDSRTKELYPYDFILEVSYEIAGDELKITYEVHNPSKEELYFSCGGHDSFALESEIENYELVFEKEEKFASELVTEDGYLTGKNRALGVEKFSIYVRICLKTAIRFVWIDSTPAASFCVKRRRKRGWRKCVFPRRKNWCFGDRRERRCSISSLGRTCPTKWVAGRNFRKKTELSKLCPTEKRA